MERSQTAGWTRRQWLSGAVAAAAALPRLGAATPPPNFIVILTDDQGYGDLGCYGSPHIRTPQIDRMAREGLRLTDFYAQPICGPSRAALMTGCYPVRNSLMFNHLPRARTGIHRDETTVAEVLKTRGYRTMMLGKWHLGDAPPFLPTRHGFDSYYGLPYSNDMWPFHPKIRPTPGESPRLTEARRHAELTGYDGQGQVYPTDWFPDLPLLENERVVALNPDLRQLTSSYTERALNFIRTRQEPFFLYLAHAMPHVPLFPSAQFAGHSRRGLYGDVIEEIDDSTGRILALLRELKLDRNTVVLFASDNGPWLPYGVDAGSAGPLRGGKGGVSEGGVRVPGIWWAPGRIPAGGVSSEIACTLDVLPTFAHLAGAALPAHKIDGKDIWPLLTTPGARSPRQDFYYYEAQLQYKAEDGRPQSRQSIKAVRSERWKLYLETSGAELRGTELYDLDSDVGEKHDVHKRNPEQVRRMEAMARAFDAEISTHIRPLGRLSDGQ